MLNHLVDAHHGARTLLLMEDAMVAAAQPADLRAFLDARYDDGDVPLTYKSFYYEMTATVALLRGVDPISITTVSKPG